MSKKVFLGLFPPPGGTFRDFDVQMFGDMFAHVSSVIQGLSSADDIHVVVFARDEETEPEIQREQDGGPAHRLFPSLQAVRVHRDLFPCHIEAWYLAETDPERAQRAAHAFVCAQGGVGLIALWDWRKLSVFHLTHHMKTHCDGYDGKVGVTTIGHTPAVSMSTG